MRNPVQQDISILVGSPEYRDEALSRRSGAWRLVLSFFGLVVVAPFTIACESEKDAMPPTTCYEPVGANATLSGCANTRACTTETVVTSVTTSNCRAPEICYWQYSDNGVEYVLEYGSPNFIYLHFGRSIAGATTTEQARAALVGVSFGVAFPVMGRTAEFAYYSEARVGAGGVDVFELLNGRLHVKVTFVAHEAHRTFFTQESTCGSDSGTCICQYGVVGIPGSIEVDLPADLPPA